MARVKKGVNAHKRHKKVLKMAKGYYGAKSKTFRAAKPAERIRRETTENCGSQESTLLQE